MTNRIDALLAKYESGAINRRQVIAALAAVAAIPDQARPSDDQPPADDEDQPAFRARSLNHVTLSVSNVERSKQFYTSILGVSTISTQKNGINLGLGDSFLGLYAIKEPPRVNHFCVGLDEFHVQVAAERLKQFGISPYVR